jgi:hypothetical protein
VERGMIAMPGRSQPRSTGQNRSLPQLAPIELGSKSRYRVHFLMAQQSVAISRRFHRVNDGSRRPTSFLLIAAHGSKDECKGSKSFFIIYALP